MARREGVGCGTVVLVLLLVVALVGLGAWKLGYIDRWLYMASVEQRASEPVSVELVDSGTAGYYVYSTLDEGDREKYRIVYDALVSREERTYPETDMDDLSRIRDFVLSDHPELFYVTGVRLLTTTNLASGVVMDVKIEGQFSYSEEEARDLQKRIDAAVEECVSGMPASAVEDDYGKAKYFYEYLAQHTTYDHEAADSTTYSNLDAEQAPSASPGQTIVDVFVDGDAVCGGYASAYQYLLQRLGIECTYVTGDAAGGRHAWCVALLDGEYYHIDPTWGDPQFTNDEAGVSEELGTVNYEYLCITTADVEKTHAVSDLFDVPLCTSEADNYFVREDLLFDWCDRVRLGTLAADAFAEGKSIQVRCTNEDAYHELLNSAVANGQLATYLPTNRYRYTYSDDFWTIALFPS